MMPEHPNVVVVRRGYDAFNKGDRDTLSVLMADDVVWHVAGRSSIAGDYEGRAATFAHFGHLHELTAGTYQRELHIAVGDEDHVISVEHGSATRGDASYAETQLVVFRFRDGHVAEAWQAPMNVYAHDEFFA
jgi:ketosteroid isomerase-like protein